MNVVVKDFPPEKWRDFKSMAVKRGLTIKGAVTEAIDGWLQRNHEPN